MPGNAQVDSDIGRGHPSLGSLTNAAPPRPATALSWRATARDDCSTTHEAVEAVTNALTGEVTNRLHRYIEVTSGLNYVNERGEWTPSQDLIELTSNGGAAAVRGPTKVLFNANLNTAGAITFITRSNRIVPTHPLALAYYDSASGKAVVLARVQDCAGELLPPNQIVYRSAFGSLADVRYTYTKAAFESDVILREQPPAPEQCGLDSRTTRLEVWHEWLEAPEPRVTRRLLTREQDEAARSRMVEPDFADEILNFGELWFPTGAAYATDGSVTRSTNVPAQVRVPNLSREPGLVAVGKTWLATAQRSFLTESVRWAEIQPKLAGLPVSRTSAPLTTPQERTMRLSQVSSPRAARATDSPVRVATSEYRPTGCVLDYITVSGSGDYTFETFRGDNTYFLGTTYFQGMVTIQSGAILKYARDGGGRLLCYGSFNIFCSGVPAILTSEDEDEFGGWLVGEPLPTSRHCASLAADVAIWDYFQSAPVEINGVRIRWARTAVQLDASGDPCSGFSHKFWDGGIEFCTTGIYLNNGTCNIGGSYYAWQCAVQSPTVISPWAVEGCSPSLGVSTMGFA